MAPIKRKSVIKGNTRVQNKTKKQASKQESSDMEEDDSDESDQSDLDYFLEQSMKDPLKMCFKLSKKEDSENFEIGVKNFFDDDEDIVDYKPNKKERNLHDSMKNLDISDKKDRPRRSQRSSKPTPGRTRKSSINSVSESQKDFNSTPARKTRSSSVNSHISEPQKDFNSTPARRTRNSSVNSHVSEARTPSTRLHNLPRVENKTPSRSERSLRTRDNQINYNENESPFEYRKKQSKRESSDNELCETPRKRGMQGRQSIVDRKPLAAVNEEISKSDNSFESVEESPEINLRKSARVRKSIVNLDINYSFDDKRKNRRSTIVSTPISRRTPKKLITPDVKRLLTPSKNTPRGSAKKMTPRILDSLTPSMQRRNVNVPKAKSNLHEFRNRLHVSFVPKSLPCREVEFNNIFTFLKCKLTEEIGGCIYISGVPGTGKTATVNEAISCLKKLESQGEIPNFEFVDINGMKLTEPRQAYVQIKKKLTGTTSSWEDSHRYLQHRFTAPASRRNMTLLLIDEMDLLCTKRQDVVYNLLDWPTYKASHLVVITIANTMDLPERVLMGRVTSRLGLTRLTFQPYNHTQLMEIVKTRLKDMEGFRKEAIELVARKVASVSGDARRALDICRRATEIAENNKKEFVTLLDVSSAMNEMIANSRVQAVKCCSLMEQTFLKAVCNEVTRIGLEQVSFKNTFRQFETLCRIEGEEVPNITQALEICRKLASWRLILWESGADLYQSILLNISADDVYYSKHKAL